MHTHLSHNGMVAEFTDLTGPPTGDPGLDLLRQATARHGVVVLRGLRLTPAEQIRMTARLGTLEPVWDELNRHPEHPDVQVISNSGPTPAVAADLWHADRSFQDVPTRYTVLHGRELPAAGGDTLYADMAAAYDGAPPEWCTALHGAFGVHTYRRLARERAAVHGGDREGTYQGRFPDVRHPAVCAHPDTGRPALYLNELCLDRVEGPDGAPVDIHVDALHAHATQDAYVYRHVWRDGDVVIWDNARVMHRATPVPAGATRVMHRSTTSGPPPSPYRARPLDDAETM